MNILEQLASEQRERVRSLLSRDADSTSFEPVDEPPSPFASKISGRRRPALIAEFKRRSPSAGVLREGANPDRFFRLYDRFADGISVLTEPDRFHGSPSDLRRAHRATSLPVLRKDVLIDTVQVKRSREMGADAVLLIASLLPGDNLNDMINAAHAENLDTLVECHAVREFRRVLASDADMVGINNRNLETLEVDKNNVQRLLDDVSGVSLDDRFIVAESGLQHRRDIEQLPPSVDAVLVGSALIKTPVPGLKLRELSGRVSVKICGVTSVENARAAFAAGADVIGLNFFEPSPRYVNPETAAEISRATGPDQYTAGVFVNEHPETVRDISNRVGLDLIQFSGDEQPEDLHPFRNTDPAIIKAVRPGSREALRNTPSYPADYLMVDAFSEGSYGGTGTLIDPEVRSYLSQINRNVAVAGGLTPGNVSGVIQSCRPVLVDVCSGVEAEPGRKDPSRMKAFVEAVRNQELTLSRSTNPSNKDVNGGT